MLIFFKLNLESDIWKIEPEDTNDENIKEELKKIQSKQNRLSELYINSAIDRTFYDKKYDALKSEYNDIVSKMEKSERNNNDEILRGNAIELYRGMSKEQKMRFMLSLIDKITVYSTTNINIDWRR